MDPFCKKRVIFCMQTFHLIFSDMSLVSNEACVLFFVFIVSLLLCDFNLQNKSNYVNFDAEQSLLAYVNQVLHCINIVRKRRLGAANIFKGGERMVVSPKRFC